MSSPSSYTVILVTWTWSSYQLYHHNYLFITVDTPGRRYRKRSSHCWYNNLPILLERLMLQGRTLQIRINQLVSCWGTIMILIDKIIGKLRLFWWFFVSRIQFSCPFLLWSQFMAIQIMVKYYLLRITVCVF